MKTQLHLFLLLILLSSSNLFAVKPTVNLGKNQIERSIHPKKKPIKGFFQNRTKRILEKKYQRMMQNKEAKREGKGVNLGLLSLIFTVLLLVSLPISSGVGILAIFGFLSFIFGIIGLITEEKKVLSILAILAFAIAFIVTIDFLGF